MKKVLMGVYGTLKRGHHNYGTFLAPRDPVFEGRFEIPFTLYSNGRYPMLIKQGHAEVFLEVYEVPEKLFQQIAEFETSFGYHVEILELNGQPINLFVYDKTVVPPGFKLVETGDFQAEIEW